MFTAYTYLADTLERVAGVPSAQVGWWLMGFGAVGLVGNSLGGRFVDRNPMGATMGFALLMGLAFIAATPSSISLATFGGVLIVWGIAQNALFPVCQVRVMQAAPQALALAGTLNVSAANAGIALGSVIGGVTIEQWGLTAVGYVAALIVLLAIPMAIVISRHKPN